MNVLAVDTSSESASLALAREGNVPEVVALPPGWHSTALHAAIVDLLDRHGLATRDISGYGVTAGPGSFTGVRIGLTAVKGLAEAHGKPVIPVSTLEVVAVAGAAQHPGSPLTVATILDARRGQIFGAIYRIDGDEFRLLVEECVCSLSSFLERAKGTGLEDLRFCGPDLERFVSEIETAGWGKASLLPILPHLAGVLAQLALERLQKGLGVPALRADANYVRPSDAELFWKG